MELVKKRGGSIKVGCISGEMMPNVAALLASGVDPNRACADGVLPLTAATAWCELRAAALLLESGARSDAAGVYWAVVAELYARGSRDFAAGAYRCGERRADEMATATDLVGRMLATRPSDLGRDLSLPHGDSLLHFAARHDLARSVERLVVAGAPLDRKNHEEQLPLDVAGPAAARVLLARGAPAGDPVAIAENRRQREFAAAREQEARRQQREAALAREAAEDAEEARAEREGRENDQREREAADAWARAQMPNTSPDPSSWGGTPGAGARPPVSTPPGSSPPGSGAAPGSPATGTSPQGGPKPEDPVCQSYRFARDEASMARNKCHWDCSAGVNDCLRDVKTSRVCIAKLNIQACEAGCKSKHPEPPRPPQCPAGSGGSGGVAR